MSHPEPVPAPAPRAAQLLAELTLDEKVELCGGVGSWHTAGVPRLGIPGMKLTDGPSGARGEGARSVNFAGNRSACFACGTALGATWDRALVARIGAAIGEEALSKGAHLLLGPTINLHRSPLAGRNFECFSEDPYLTGELAAAYVNGLQSQGVGATLKHLVCNESEFQRHTLSSRVDDRTLHEVYLRPFQIAATSAAPVAIMTAYNRVNGIAASDHHEIISDIVKREWGFDGIVISDWGGTRSTIGAANAGLDLEMPGPPKFFGDQLLEAVARGQVTVAVIDEKVRRHLRSRERTGAWGRGAVPERTVDDPEHRAISRSAAASSMVLLQNPRQLLPLDPARQRRIAVIGPNSGRAVIQGGGSSQVAPHPVSSPLEAIEALVGGDVEVTHEAGCRIHRRTPDLDLRLVRPAGAPPEAAGSISAEYHRTDARGLGTVVTETTEDRTRFLWPQHPGTGSAPTTVSARFSATFRSSATGSWTFGVVVIAGDARLLLDGEPIVEAHAEPRSGAELFDDGSREVTSRLDLGVGEDHDLVVEFQALPGQGLAGLAIVSLGPQPPHQMRSAARAAAEADTVVLVVGLDEDWETEGRDRDQFALPGAQPELIARVTEANADTVVVVNAGTPVDLSAVPESAALLQIWYPGQEGAGALADVLFGRSEPGGRLPTTLPRNIRDTPSHGNYPGELGEVRYAEGLLIGHRWYDSQGIEPAFPFGFGLSTTTIEWADVALTGSIRSDDLEISLTVSNSGERRGVEVVQVYAHFPMATVTRPEQQLVAFSKVHLDPGETSTVSIPVESANLMFRDPVAGEWQLDSGSVELRIGRHSRDPAHVIAIDV